VYLLFLESNVMFFPKSSYLTLLIKVPVNESYLHLCTLENSLRAYAVTIVLYYKSFSYFKGT